MSRTPPPPEPDIRIVLRERLQTLVPGGVPAEIAERHISATVEQLVASYAHFMAIPDAAYRQRALVVMSSPVGARVLEDCRAAGWAARRSVEYAEAVMTSLGLAASNVANRSTSLTTWENQGEKIRTTFTMQALPMRFDYAEVNPFARAGFARVVENMAAAIERLPAGAGVIRVSQADPFGSPVEAP